MHHPRSVLVPLISQAARAMRDAGAHPSRTVVLVPYAQLMAAGRCAWAACEPDGFVPRFETTDNWARAAGFSAQPGDLSMSMARDLPTARSLLDRAGVGSRAGALAQRLVEAAWQLAPVAASFDRDARSEWAAQARQAIPVDGGDAFAIEQAIARIAIEWAAASAYAADALITGDAARQADHLVVLRGLRRNPVADSLAACFGDRAMPLSFPIPALRGAIAFHEAEDPADEAERAAACVLRHVEAGHVPVALVAQDRVLTRRVVAMLDSRGIPIHDETGWKLSTTRAASRVTAALRACAWDATSDAMLDWLKGVDAVREWRTLALERRLRRAGVRDWRALREADLAGSEDLLDLVAQIDAWRADLREPRPLSAWLDALGQLLDATGGRQQLQRDAAGARVLDVLALDAGTRELAGIPHAEQRLTLAEFSSWISAVLEAESFTPPHPDDAQVVVLPLHQILGRDLGAVVMPGCDESTLDPCPPLPAPWTPAQRERLGLSTREDEAASLAAAFAFATALPHVDLLWRRTSDTGEPLLPSPLLQALRLAGEGVPGEDPRIVRQVRADPVCPPAAVGSALAVTSVSASAYDDLRKCPYRFFALRQLRLQDADELDTEVDKRDFGNWLHRVLADFHMRLHSQPDAERAAIMDSAAEEATRAMGLDDAEFLPFRAAWPRVRDGYLAWLDKHEKVARFAESESEHRRDLGTITLEGRIDRIDRLADGGAMVMDYKTESLDVTRQRVKRPQEDTQLAFYAALVGDDVARAGYVNVSEREGTNWVEQGAVLDMRDRLVEGLRHDLAQIAGGSVMPALGAGVVCEWCSARGLCRRDWWA